MVSSNKSLLRQLLKAKREALPEVVQQTCSRQICERIVSSPFYKKAKYLALYRAFGKEVNIDAVWHDAYLAGKSCYFPKMTSQGLRFIQATPATPFIKNKSGILEPGIDEPQQVKEWDVFFLPLVGFNKEGGRLGMGAGCYDKFLAHYPQACCVGVGYAFQECEDLICEANDYPLDLVVTERAVLEMK